MKPWLKWLLIVLAAGVVVGALIYASVAGALDRFWPWLDGFARTAGFGALAAVLAAVIAYAAATARIRYDRQVEADRRTHAVESAEQTRRWEMLMWVYENIDVGDPDPTLTPAAGMLAVSELVDRLGVVSAIDEAVGPIKQRARGLSAGEFLVGVASAQMAGEDYLIGLDRRRADSAGAVLSPVPVAPSTIAATLARRFDTERRHRLESALAQVAGRVLQHVGQERRGHLPSGHTAVNTAWMWGALLAVNLSAWLHELGGLDNGQGRRRAHLGRLRRELICIPGRVTYHARRINLRLPPGMTLLAEVLARLRKLPATA